MAGNYRNLLLWSTAGGGIFQDGRADQPYPSAPVPVPAVQLNATGNSSTSTNGGIIDLASVKEVLLLVALTGFTGGTTPSFQPEWDVLSDGASPIVAPLWKPAAATAPTNWLTSIGIGVGNAPTIAGWTYAAVGLGFGTIGRMAWTVTGAPTAVAWSAYVYAKFGA